MKLIQNNLSIWMALLLIANIGYSQKVVQDSLESNQFLSSPTGISEQTPPDTSYITLNDAIQEALANNDLLKKNGAQIKAGQVRLQQAEGELLPRIDANFAYSYLDIMPGFRANTLEILNIISSRQFRSVSRSIPAVSSNWLKNSPG